MAKQKQQTNDDYYHYDGVYIGPPVEPSVFYRGRRPAPCHSCKKGSQLAAQAEAERVAENKRAQRERQKKYREQRKRRWLR